MKRCLSLVVVVATTLACHPKSNRASGGGEGSESGSQLSSITMRLPDKTKFKEPELLSGYRLVIEPIDDNCPRATRVNKVALWSDTTLSEKIAQGCDYSIGMQLGKLSADKTQIATSDIYFSNYTDAKSGKKLPRTEIDGRSTVNLTIELTITKEGEAKGFGKEGTKEQTPGETDLDIKVEFKTPSPSPTPTATPTAAEPVITELTAGGDAGCPLTTESKIEDKGRGFRFDLKGNGVRSETATKPEKLAYCYLNVKMTIPPTKQCALGQASITTLRNLAAGGTARFTTELRFEGSISGVTAINSKETTANPDEQSYAMAENTEALWSSCGVSNVSQTLKVKTIVIVGSELDNGLSNLAQVTLVKGSLTKSDGSLVCRPCQ